MNRFSLIFLVWIFCAAAAWPVLSGSGRPQPPEPVRSPHGELSRSSLFMEISTTFDLSEDPFALDASSPSGLLVHENGRQIHSIRDLASEKTPLMLAIHPGTGETEYRIQASGDTDMHRPAALRVRILERETVIGDRTAWSSDGPLQLFLTLPPSGGGSHG